MLNEMKNLFSENMLDANQYGALTLAYIGDCVYELYVRTYLIRQKDSRVKALHKQATALVCASAQAAFYHRIEHLLEEDEVAVFHRGRNTKSQVPKHAQLSDYRTATGVEALLGYLYLRGREERIAQLMKYLFCTENAKSE